MESELIQWSAANGHVLLSDCPDRLKHVLGVVSKASWVGGILVGTDCEHLLAAAWLHDVGYASALRRTGLHQLDGAAFVRRQGYERLAALVAHHSEARFEVYLRGHGIDLGQYPREESWTSDALTYCDVTTGVRGDPVSFEDRVSEVEQRYGQGKIVDALSQARPSLQRAVERTQERLRDAGLFTCATR